MVVNQIEIVAFACTRVKTVLSVVDVEFYKPQLGKDLFWFCSNELITSPVNHLTMADEAEVAEVEQKPIDKWDGSAVKNRLDDAVKYYLTNDLKFVESFLLIDLRLFISSAAVGVATFALIWDYLNPFPISRPVLLSCVLLYFVFMILLTLYTTFLEKGTFLKASKDNKYLTVSSYMKRFDDIYTLYVEQKVSGGPKLEEKLEYSVAKWFDEKGFFLEKRFEDDLKNLLSKVQRKH